MTEPMKHIDYLKVTKGYTNFIPTANTIGEFGPAVTNMINNELAIYVSPLGVPLTNMVATNVDTEMGIYLSEIVSMIEAFTGEPYQSSDGERRVHAALSQRCPTTNLSNITGLVIDFINQPALVDATSLRFEYVAAGTTIRGTFNGGTTWGNPVDVSTLAANEGIVLHCGGSLGNTVSIRRTGIALPVTNQSDTIPVNNANFAIKYWYNNVDRPEESDSRQSAFTIPDNDTLGLFLPIIAQASMIYPSAQLYDIVDLIDTIEGGVASTTEITGTETRTDINTSVSATIGLSFTPITQEALEVVCQGYRFTPGVAFDYTVAANMVTFYPANMGFHILPGEPVFFRGFTA